MTLTVNATAISGFNSAISLSCSGPPAGVNCLFSPNTITPGGGGASSALTLSVSQGYQAMAMMGWLPFSGIGLFGLVFASPADNSVKRKILRRTAVAGALVLITLLLLMAVGCGSGMTNHMTNNGGTINLLVTGSSGGLKHSVQVALTVN